MPEIQLSDYTAKIKELIHSDRCDEAIAHCQHILRHYPKHIETYCLLGEACLEKGMYREAIEFFQRTLSADPENFIARVGLGIIYGEQGAVPEAIWQMERAFELAPGNAEVRRELQRLYAQRDGVEKARLKLTQGALGRLYAHNGLYERAINEFRAVLRQEPDLPDVRVALAESLWREGRRLEAVEVCLEILGALPNSLKANLILGEIWLRGGHEDASQEKLNIAQALDPENRVAYEMMGRESPLLPERVLIPELEVSADMFKGITLPEIEEPLGALWREEAQAPAEEAPEEKALALWEEAEEVPDWLQEIGLVKEEGPALAPAAPTLREEFAAAEEVPDWLQELVGEEEKLVSEEVPPAAGLFEEKALPGEIPEWLQELVRPPAARAAPAEEPTAEEEVPEWLRAPEAPAEEAAPPVAEEEVPEWLKELIAEEEMPAVIEAAPLAEVPPVEVVAPPAELAAEELLPVEEEVSPVATPPVRVEMVAPAEVKAAPPSRLEALLAQLNTRPRDYHARLELARLYRDEQNWALALTHYERLVSARKLLPAVINDLELMLKEEKEQARLCQLLGDAYVQDERLDEALNMYRLARQALLKR